jgi:Cu+-exporting ATPase
VFLHRLITKTPEDSVTGGTVAYEAPIVIRATATGSSSTLAGIGRLVTEAQSREAPVQRLADVVAGYFCYSVMTLSAATFLFWYTTGSAWYPQALDAVDVDGASASLLLSVKLAIDVLVVACPCALGLATPTAVLVASSAGARRGLLIRGGDILERLAKIDTVVLDKTGTLTEGKLRLKELNAFAGYTKGDVLALAAAVESLTTHPLAAAVKQAALNEGE